MKQTLLVWAALAALALPVRSQTIIPNPGFESWGNIAGEDAQPMSWISYNIFTSPLVPNSSNNPTSVTQAGTPNNYQGNYSARIETVTLVSNPDSANIPSTAGVLFTGSIAFTPPYNMFAGYQSQQRPQTLSYFAKYAPMGNDSAFCVVAVTRWNGSGRDTIAVGFDIMSSAITSYQQRMVNLIYDASHANTIPDSINIMFSASNQLNPQVGSVLWVDALVFSGYVGVEDHVNSSVTHVYPNPSNTFTQFDVTTEDAKQVVVYDMSGREVSRTVFSGKSARLNTGELADGVYTYCIFTVSEEILSRGQFSVAH